MSPIPPETWLYLVMYIPPSLRPDVKGSKGPTMACGAPSAHPPLHPPPPSTAAPVCPTVAPHHRAIQPAAPSPLPPCPRRALCRPFLPPFLPSSSFCPPFPPPCPFCRPFCHAAHFMSDDVGRTFSSSSMSRQLGLEARDRTNRSLKRPVTSWRWEGEGERQMGAGDGRRWQPGGRGQGEEGRARLAA